MAGIGRQAGGGRAPGQRQVNPGLRRVDPGQRRADPGRGGASDGSGAEVVGRHPHRLFEHAREVLRILES